MSRTIGIWGDSILKGLVLQPGRNRYTVLKEEDAVTLVQQQLELPVHNHCRIGINSKKGLDLLDQYIDRYKAGDIALLCFGGNDSDFDWKEVAEDPDANHLSQVTPEDFRKNLIQMVEKIRNVQMVPLLVALPPIDSERYFQWISRGIEKKNQILKWLGDVDRISRYHSQYNEIIRGIAEEMNVRFINIRKAFCEKGDFRSFLCGDGIHPNAQGHRCMAEEMLHYAGEADVKALLFRDPAPTPH